MTKPTEPYDWATNASYAGGPDIGTDTKIEPPTVTVEDGWRGNQKPPPQYQNHWQNAIAKTVDYVHGVLEATDSPPAVSRVVVLSPAAAMQNPAAGVTSNHWQGLGTKIQSLVNTAGAIIPFELPHGAILTALEILVNPGAARTSGNNMAAVVTKSTPDFVTPALSTSNVVSLFEDDTTTNLQVMTPGALAITIDSESFYVINISAGNTAAASPDTIEAIRLTFTDPGPRNF